MSIATTINSHDAIQNRLSSGNLPRYGPMLMLVARSLFILLAQGLTFLSLLQLGVPNAYMVIRNWWPIYGTLVDLGCLALLIWLTRQEGIRLQDLVGVVKSKLKTEIPLGVGLFLFIFPLVMGGGGLVAQLLVYGKLNPEFPQYTFMRILPVWALLYARILWWPIWSATEEMTYNGYALPRLAEMTGSRWKAVLIVAFFFSLQHSFLMLAGFQFCLYMFLAFVPLTVALEWVYLRIRRLPPMIVAHWLMDLANVLFLYRMG
ncbi:MAG TPA: CPBP family intramembrane glutamic endopeptidase [Anaerolineales bacterium]|nr:CPBP family intramembrane glutamic endopeptidase [Anaerolineales bacterium]